MTTLLSPVLQLQLSHTPAGKRGPTLQAGMGAWALLRAATTTARPWTLSSCPWTQFRPWHLVVPTTKEQNNPWKQVLACPCTYPRSLLILRVADMTGWLEVSNAEGSKHPGFSQILLSFPWRVGTRFSPLKELLEMWFYIWLSMAVKDNCSGQCLCNTTFLSQMKPVFW